MDELVLEAMARWPDVPAVWGWLRLDRRGGWHLIDRGMPGFDERLHGRGSPITSPPIVDFIGRNLGHDQRGNWFWQNGPQRVYYDVDVAPLVLRVLGSGVQARLVTHTGHAVAEATRGWVGPDGEILLATDLGPGVVHDLDAAQLDLQAREGPGGRETLVLALGGREIALEPAEDPAEAMGFVARPRPG